MYLVKHINSFKFLRVIDGGRSICHRLVGRIVSIKSFSPQIPLVLGGEDQENSLGQAARKVEEFLKNENSE